MIGTSRALLLDVGGVLVLPRHETVAAALSTAGARYDPSRLDAAHYAGVAAIDEPDVTADDRSAVYRAAFVEMLEVSPARRASASGALADAFRSPGAWSRPGHGAVELLLACAAHEVSVGIVSNWDGTVARLLAEAGICQLGPGPLPRVEVIVDSAVVGWEKPDPRIFRVALDALGIEPARAVHVGDSVRADVDGAVAAGVAPIHLDPLGRCPRADHAHAVDLLEVAGLLGLIVPTAPAEMA
ncbi:MAG TPA: HAD family hydrolase [Candidatus Limnocylindrales bacterium]|nr:HAD family hydrolase [Candidatus Limnocylindrales bacterium]